MAVRLPLGSHGPLHLWPFRLLPQDRDTHKQVIGTTGSGKSKFLTGLAKALRKQGVPFCLIDPHGDLADELLAHLIQGGRIPSDVTYLELGRPDAHLPFNVLNQPYPVDKIAEHIIQVCLRAWPNLAGGNAPTFERLMRNTVKVLCYNNLPITFVSPVLDHKPLREALLRQVPDQWVVRFFHQSFDRWGREEQRMKESTVNRGDLLTATETMRLMLGQRDNALQFSHLMDERQSLIVNLQGLEEQEMRFLGAFIAHGFEVAAYNRGIPGSDRHPYHLIMDEAPMYIPQTETAINNMLSRTRKYGLFLTIAHQTLSQFSERLQDALQNTLMLAFGLGTHDAEFVTKVLTDIDLEKVKDEVEDPHAKERTHPMFYPVMEQYAETMTELRKLEPQEFLIRCRRQRGFKWHRHGWRLALRRRIIKEVCHVRAMDVHDPPVSPEALQRIKDDIAQQSMTQSHRVNEHLVSMPEPYGSLFNTRDQPFGLPPPPMSE